MLVVVNHLLNDWNFLLAWFVYLKVPNWFGLSIPSSIREEGNLSFLLRQTELVLVQNPFTLDDQWVLSL